MEPLLAVLAVAAAAAAFTLSASAGFGGSLILVPSLALVLGTKPGVALAALLLACNNIVKVIAYRNTLPYRRAAFIALLVMAGTAVGARLLVSAPDNVVTLAVIASFAITFLGEGLDLSRFRRSWSWVLALGAGATSGFSGTAGPLKGLAVRSLDLDRLHLVGALSLISLVGDATKAAIFTEAGLISANGYYLAAATFPVMIAATFAGRRINQSIGERGFTVLFWLVMGGYTARLLSGI